MKRPLKSLFIISMFPFLPFFSNHLSNILRYLISVMNCTSKHFTKVLSREMPLKNNKTRFFVLYTDRTRFQPVRVLAVSSLYLTSVKRDLLSAHTIQLT